MTPTETEAAPRTPTQSRLPRRRAVHRSRPPSTCRSSHHQQSQRRTPAGPLQCRRIDEDGVTMELRWKQARLSRLHASTVPRTRIPSAQLMRSTNQHRASCVDDAPSYGRARSAIVHRAATPTSRRARRGRKPASRTTMADRALGRGSSGSDRRPPGQNPNRACVRCTCCLRSFRGRAEPLG